MLKGKQAGLLHWMSWKLRCIRSNKWYCEIRTLDVAAVSGGADTEAVESSGERSLYEALRLVLQSVKVEISITPTDETFVSLSAHSWILGKSKLLESCAEHGLIARKLMLDLLKMGEYFRGTKRLFNH